MLELKLNIPQFYSDFFETFMIVFSSFLVIKPRLFLLQPHHACHFKHEAPHAFLVSVCLTDLISTDWVIHSHWNTNCHFFFFLIYLRFDIHDLSHNAKEDEAGIKRASDNSRSLKQSLKKKYN